MAEQDTMMQEMAKLAAPGKEHQMLARHAGNYDVTMKMWMNPNDPPGEAHGTATLKMILGGRFLVEDFKADIMGQPFEGHGMMGYDNFRGRWWQTWMDNWSTGIYKGEGSASPDGKTVSMTGKSDRAAQNQKDVQMKGVYHFIADNHHIFETYDIAPNGEEKKTMEIEYRRK